MNMGSRGAKRQVLGLCAAESPSRNVSSHHACVREHWIIGISDARHDVQRRFPSETDILSGTGYALAGRVGSEQGADWLTQSLTDSASVPAGVNPSVRKACVLAASAVSNALSAL